MTGLIPILKEMHNPWFMQFFSEEAKLRHATSKWDAKTRSAVPAEEVELDGFLTEDNEMNQTEVSILKPASRTPEVEICRPVVAELESFPKMYNDTNSVSMFNPIASKNSAQPFTLFTPKIIDLSMPDMQEESSTTIPSNVVHQDSDAVSTILDAESRLSTLTSHLSHLAAV